MLSDVNLLVSEMTNDIETSGSAWGPLLDQLKEKEELRSDAALARRLGVTRSFISSVRANRKNISAELGEQIFELLEREVGRDDVEIFKPLRVQKYASRRGLNSAEKALAFARAKGHCELCGAPAPFRTPQGQPYLEIHRLRPLAAGKSSNVANLVALCPNCHRKVEIIPSKEDIDHLRARADHPTTLEQGYKDD